MKISVLSIPGLPNGFLSLDSKLYHDYESILGVIHEVMGESVPTFFQSYLWPQEVTHPDYEWLLKIPGLTLPLYYLLYQLDAEFRKKIVDKAVDYIREGLAQGDVLFLILHSHGNRVAFDALLELKRRGELENESVVVLSFAPAYKKVARGWVPPGLTEGELNEVESSVDCLLSFRMRKDFLSGDPDLEKTYLFDPKFYEVGWLGHANIRSREDVMHALKLALKKEMPKQ